MLRLSCKMLWDCFVFNIPFDFGKLLNALPTHATPTMMFPSPCFIVLLTTCIAWGSLCLFQHHSRPSDLKMLNLLSFENMIFLHCSSIQSLKYVVHSRLNCLWQSKRRGIFFLIVGYSLWLFSAFLNELNGSCNIWDLSKNPLTFYYNIYYYYYYYFHQSCQIPNHSSLQECANALTLPYSTAST